MLGPINRSLRVQTRLRWLEKSCLRGWCFPRQQRGVRYCRRAMTKPRGLPGKVMLRHSRFDGLTGWLINRLTAQARRFTQPLLLPRPQPRRFLMSWIEVMNHHQNPRTRTKISRATNAAKNFASLLLNASKSLTACSFRKLHFGQHPFHPRLGVRVEQVGKQQASLRAPRFSHPVGVGIFNRLGFCADHFRRLLCATRDNDRSTAFRAPVSAASPFIRGTQLRGTRKTDERYGHKSTSSLPEPSFRSCCRYLPAAGPPSKSYPGGNRPEG